MVFTGQPGTANAQAGFLWPGTAGTVAVATDPVFRSAATATTNTGGANSSITGNLASTTVGDINVLCLDVSSNTVTTADPGIPTINGTSIAAAGWNLIDSSVDTAAANTPRLTWVWRIVQAGDAAITWAWSGSVGNAAAGGVAYQAGTFDPTNPFPAAGHSMQVQTPSSTSFATPSVTTTVTGLLLSVFGCRTTGTWTAPTGDTKRLDAYSSAAANFALCEAPSAVAAGTYSKTGTFSVATSVGNQGIALLASTTGGGSSLTASPADPVGITDTAAAVADYVRAPADPVGVTDAATPVLSGSGTASPADPVGVTDTVVAVQDIVRSLADPVGVTDSGLATTPAILWMNAAGARYVAHRGGFAATLGEGTLEAYQAAAAQYTQAALEISFWVTSDGVYVSSHDQTTGRVFSGTSLDIPTNTWAALSGKTTLIGGNPIRKVDDIIAALPGRIFLIDNKQNTNNSTRAAYVNALLPGRLIGKQIVTDPGWINTCAGLGWPVWAYGYPADTPNFATNVTTNLAPALSSGVPVVLGFGDYSSGAPTQADTTSFVSAASGAGLKWWAHILGTTAQKTDADTKGTTAGLAPSGYMVSGFSTVAPTDNTSPADPVGVTDSATPTQAAVRAPADPVGVTDTAGAVQDIARTPADPVGVTDASAAVQDTQRGPADPVGVSDAAAVAQTVARGPADPVGATDSAAAVQDNVRAAADPVGVTDAGTPVQDVARPAADPVGVTDSAVTAAAVPRSAADPVNVTDTVTAAQDVPRAAADPVGATDAATPVQDAARAVSDPVGVTDSASATLVGAGAAAAADNVGLTDQAAAAQDNARAVADAIGVTDQAAATISLAKAAADPVGVTDVAGAAQDAARAPADAVGLTDVVTIVLTSAGVITVDNPVGVTDSISTAIAAGRAIAELVTVTDAALAVLTGEGRDITVVAALTAQVRPVTAALGARPASATLAASRRFQAVLEEQP